MARTLVSIVVAWDSHLHGSVFLCGSLTATVTYTDTVNLNPKNGSTTHVLSKSISKQTDLTTGLSVDTTLQDTVVTDLQNLAVALIPTTLTDAQSKTTITKSAVYL